MRLQINQNELREIPDDNTLGDVISRLRHEKLTEGHVLATATLDGKSFILEENSPILLERAGEHQLLEIVTQTPSQLCACVLEELKKYCPNLSRYQEEASHLLEHPKLEIKEQGMATIQSCFKVWAVLSDSINKISILLALNLETLTYQGKPLGALIQGLIGLAEKTREAMDSQNYPRLAELIRTDWNPLVPEWDAAIDALLAIINTPR